MSYEAVDCVDAGTEYCPCYLAETNNCLICSQLQGKVFCDCVNWKGVCIYQEFVWNGNKMKEPRENIPADILEKKFLNENVLFLKLKVSKTLARELNQPGSYIFIRDTDYPEFFDTPMSIMYSDEINGTIDILVQIRGAKTKVFKNENLSLTIRGPYWNGVMGLKNLKITANKSCLIIARGMAQAPSVIVAKKLRFSGNSVIVILDEGSSGSDISKLYFEKSGCTIIKAELLNNRSFTQESQNLITDIIHKNNVDLIFSAGTDIIHKSIIGIKKSFSKNILFACTNNATICCGEGICGSCSMRLKDGRRIKECKAQIDPVEIMEGI